MRRGADMTSLLEGWRREVVFVEVGFFGFVVEVFWFFGWLLVHFLIGIKNGIFLENPFFQNTPPPPKKNHKNFPKNLFPSINIISFTRVDLVEYLISRINTTKSVLHMISTIFLWASKNGKLSNQ